MKKELFQILPLDGVVKTFSCLRTGKKFPLVAELWAPPEASRGSRRDTAKY